MTKLEFYGIIAVVLIALGIFCVWEWRADIKQVVYDQIFRSLAQDEIARKDAEIKRLEAMNDAERKSVAKAQAEAAQNQKKVDALTKTVQAQTYSKELLSPGMSRTLDAIQDYTQSSQPVPIVIAPGAK